MELLTIYCNLNVRVGAEGVAKGANTFKIAWWGRRALRDRGRGRLRGCTMRCIFHTDVNTFCCAAFGQIFRVRSNFSALRLSRNKYVYLKSHGKICVVFRLSYKLNPNSSRSNTEYKYKFVHLNDTVQPMNGGLNSSYGPFSQNRWLFLRALIFYRNRVGTLKQVHEATHSSSSGTQHHWENRWWVILRHFGHPVSWSWPWLVDLPRFPRTCPKYPRNRPATPVQPPNAAGSLSLVLYVVRYI